MAEPTLSQKLLLNENYEEDETVWDKGTATGSIAQSSTKDVELESFPFTRSDNESIKSDDPMHPKYEYGEGMSWQQALFLMTVSLIGIGVLGIPVAIKYLGWGLGVFGIIALGVFCCYSGLVISSIVMHATKVGDCRPRKYRNLGRLAFGPKGDGVVFWAQMAAIAGFLVAGQHVAAVALQSFVISIGGSMCIVVANLIVTLLMLPVMQIQTLKGVTTIALVGVILIIVAVAVYLWQVVDTERKPSSETDANPEGFDPIVSGFTTIAFAYQGQAIFPEIQSEMKRPQDMPKAVIGTTCIMVAVYTFVGLLGYAYLGSSAEFLEVWSDKHLSHASSTAVGDICLFFHVLAGFTINANVLNQAACEYYLGPPKTKAEEEGGGIIDHKRSSWFIVTFITAVIAFLISNIVPSIGLLVSLLGATCGNALTFLIPITVLIKIVKMEQWQKSIHQILLFLAVVITAVETYQSIKDMALGIADSAPPFTCAHPGDK